MGAVVGLLLVPIAVSPSLGLDAMKRIAVNTLPLARTFIIVCRFTL
jgi:hypothetical protein